MSPFVSRVVLFVFSSVVWAHQHHEQNKKENSIAECSHLCLPGLETCHNGVCKLVKAAKFWSKIEPPVAKDQLHEKFTAPSSITDRLRSRPPSSTLRRAKRAQTKINENVRLSKRTGAARNYSSLSMISDRGSTTDRYTGTFEPPNAYDPLTEQEDDPPTTIQPWESLDPDDPCAHAPCINGGRCKNKARNRLPYTCVCPKPGYDPDDHCHLCLQGLYGQDCKLLCGPCGLYDGSKQGKYIYKKFNSNFGSYCSPELGCMTCLPPFSGPPKCESVNKTLVEKLERSNTNPCKPGWFIKDKCVCPIGYKGVTCKEIDHDPKAECQGQAKANCGDLGKCVLIEGQHRCQCFSGSTEVGVKEKNPHCTKGCVEGSLTCLNGKCVREGNIQQKRCECEYGFKGKTCTDRCDSHQWGKDCSRVCGNCRILPCLPDTGFCTGPGNENLCFSGFTGLQCLDRDYSKPAKVVARFRLHFSGKFQQSALGLLQPFVEEASLEAARQMGVSFAETSQFLSSPGSVVVSFAMSFNKSDVDNIDLGEALPGSLKKEVKKIPPVRGYKVLPETLTFTGIVTPREQAGALSGSDNTHYAYAIVIAMLGVAALFIPVVAIFAIKKKSTSNSHSRRNYNRRHAKTDALELQNWLITSREPQSVTLTEHRRGQRQQRTNSSLGTAMNSAGFDSKYHSIIETAPISVSHLYRQGGTSSSRKENSHLFSEGELYIGGSSKGNDGGNHLKRHVRSSYLDIKKSRHKEADHSSQSKHKKRKDHMAHGKRSITNGSKYFEKSRKYSENRNIHPLAESGAPGYKRSKAEDVAVELPVPFYPSKRRGTALEDLEETEEIHKNTESSTEVV